MALEQLELETGFNKVDVAIALLQAWEPPDGYYLAFSGGKDSVAIYDLAVKAKVKFDAHYCVSPIDPPQVRSFIKEHYPDVMWDYNAKGFWNMVTTNGLPTRISRWCCRVIKESGGNGRVVIVGNRRAEGTVRKHQCYVEAHRNPKVKKTFIRPILNFDDYDIWQYIHENTLPVCELYHQGFARIGCVLCPFCRNVEREETAFPEIAKLWRRAADRVVARMIAQNYISKRGKPMKHRFETGEELYQWWINRK